VLFPELFPVPTLEEVAEDLETLIDYAMTQHHLPYEEKTLDLLRKQNTSALLASLRERNAHPHAVDIGSSL